MKLVLAESETAALQTALAGRALISSELSVTEIARGANKRGEQGLIAARRALATADIAAVDSAILELAAELEPWSLRTLDAIHLATAFALGRDCEGVITYDVRMQNAAREAGLIVLAPGQAPN